MLALLTKFLPLSSLLKYGLIAAVLAGAGFYVWHLRSTVTAQHATIAGLKTDVAKIAATSARNAAAAKQAATQASAAEAALQVFMGQSVVSSKALGGQLATIKAAPAPAQAATVPPLVWQTIQGLKP